MKWFHWATLLFVIGFGAVAIMWALQLQLYEPYKTGLPNGDGPRIDSDGDPCYEAMCRGDYDTALKHVKRLQRRAHMWHEEQRYFAIECIWGVAADLENDLERWKTQGKRIERGSSLDEIITITIQEMRLSRDPDMKATIDPFLREFERLVKEVGRI